MDKTLAERLEWYAAAYPEYVFPPPTEADRAAHGHIIQAAAAATCRHMAPMLLEAARAVREGNAMLEAAAALRATTGEGGWEYYYRQSDCPAADSADDDCVCWHAEGTGPFANEQHDAMDSTLEWRRAANPGPAQVDEGAVERAAQALSMIDDCSFTNWGDLPDYGQDRYRDKARAALTAAAKEGWVMVPREPTTAMLVAANAAWFIPDPSPFDKGDEARRAIYAAMLAAAAKEKDRG